MKEIIAEGCAMRERGASVPQIIRKLGGTRQVWQYRLIAHGAERYGVVQVCPSISRWDAEIASLRREGASIGGIAQVLRLSKSYMQNRLIRIARREAWIEAHQTKPAPVAKPEPANPTNTLGEETTNGYGACAPNVNLSVLRRTRRALGLAAQTTAT